MAHTKERQASSLTLALQRREADRFISRALSVKSPANCPASLDQALDAALADGLAAPSSESRLGRPLNINEVAAMIGCSPWTVRKRLLPKGLPYFRSAASGKLIFYRDQVIRWIERKQKGG